jgi:bacillolysin
MRKNLIFLLLLGVFSVQAQMKNAKKRPTPSVNIDKDFKPILKKPSYEHSEVQATSEAALELKVITNFKKPNAGSNLEITRDRTGNIIFVEGTKDLFPTSNRSIGQKAEAYINAIASDLGFRQNPSFQVLNIQQDETNEQHIKMQQMLQNIPVYGAEIVLHTLEGEVFSMNGHYYNDINITEFVPQQDIESIKQIIDADLVKKEIEKVENSLTKEKFKAELVIYPIKKQKDAAFLAWHITIRPNAMARYEYFIDAKNGKILHTFNHTCNFTGHHFCNAPSEVMDGSVDATASDLFGTPRNLKTYLSTGNYYMIDISRSMYSATKSKMPDDPIGAIWTLDAFNTSPEKSTFKYDHVTSLDNKWGSKSGAVSAHYNAGLAFDYFKKTHNRNSINGQGGTIISLVNIVEKTGKSMENAFWNGEAMFYGNGGSAFEPLAKGLDVAGHEMSHGVIQNTANLEYEGEPGALNESFADIFGAMIDRDDWKIGEDVVKKAVFPTGALRDLANPNNGGKNLNDNGWQPKHTNEQYKGTDDNGGVHINSGITNFAFYKYATALGSKDKAEKIYYHALSNYLVKSSNFIDLRVAIKKSAEALYGKGANEVTQADLAFDAVGIGSTTSTPGNYQNDTKVNPGSDIIAYTDNNYSTINTYFPSTKTTKKLTDTDINSRPSVTDDGSYMVFVAADKSIHGLILNWQNGTVEEEIISSEKVWRNAIISKDGNRLAATLDAEDNRVFVYDFAKNPVASKVFTLTNPTYTQGVSTGDVQYADAMEFDVTGDNIMYDAFSLIKGNKGEIEYWDIGFLRAFNSKAKTFGDGKIQKLFSDLPEGTSIGNPTFSKNSPYIVAFDYQDELDLFKTYVLTANIETGDVGEIYYNGKDLFGFPSFSRIDDKLLFETKDAIGNYCGTIDLATNKLAPKTSNANPFLIVDQSRWPLWFANGKRVLVSNHDVTNDIFKVFPNPFDVSLNILFKTDAQHLYRLIDITGKTILQGNTENQTLNLSLESLPKGTYILQADGAIQKIIKL